MLHPLTRVSIPDYVRDLPIVAVYTLTIYVLLIIAFRYFGRRQLGQLNVIDLVIIIIMGSAVETAMVHGNLSLPAGLVSASTLLIANRSISLLAHRYKWFRRFVSPGPILLVSRGQVIDEHLKKSGLTHEDVLEAVRERGFADVGAVKFAVLEEDGEINVIANTAKSTDTVIG
jgi:uncharacterized membrane protein YcaP (DUF421 family)